MPTVSLRTAAGLVAFAAYIGTVFAANWAVQRYGFVPVGFGLTAPAGTYFIGLAFTFRDLTQNTLGRWFSLLAIFIAAALSYFVSPAFALASGAAALFGELADFAVYTPLYKRGWLRALIPANLAGLVVDSVLFLWLAFGSIAHVEGQIVGKLWMTALAVLVLSPIRRWYVLTPGRDSGIPTRAGAAA